MTMPPLKCAIILSIKHVYIKVDFMAPAAALSISLGFRGNASQGQPGHLDLIIVFGGNDLVIPTNTLGDKRRYNGSSFVFCHKEY